MDRDSRLDFLSEFLPEFEDYYKYVSITIEDDYLFEETLIYCWKLSKSKIAHAGPKDNIKKIFENPAPETPSESVVSNNISIPGQKSKKHCGTKIYQEHCFKKALFRFS